MSNERQTLISFGFGFVPLWRRLLSAKFKVIVLTIFLFSVSIYLADAVIAQSEGEENQHDLLLSDGGGADNGIVVVRDLNAALEAFGKRLGFNIKASGKFPDGIENSVVYFKTGMYLEFLGVFDRIKAKDTPEVKFLESYEGAIGMALEIPSADRAANRLIKRGFEINGPNRYPPGTVGQQPQNWLWRTVKFKKPEMPGGDVFFIEYKESLEQLRSKNPQKYAASRTHPNTAEKVQAVWIAVKNLDSAVKIYESIGLKAGNQVSFSKLKAKGREIIVGESLIVLLEADGRGKAASFLKQRGESIMGVSIKVGDLNTAKKMIEINLKQRIKTYKGAYGKSLLAPFEETHGIWVELYQ